MSRLPTAAVASAAVLLLVLAVTGGSAHAAAPDDNETDDSGLALLRQAAGAARAESYYGTQFVTSWSPHGSVSSLIEITSTPGLGMTVRPTVTDPEASGTLERVDPASPAGGLVAPQDEMIDVMARNYQVVAAGGGQVCGRPSSVVHVVRPGGADAARYWIDDASGVILRREILDGRGRLASASAFIDFRSTAAAPKIAAATDTSVYAAPDVLALQAKGWTFPSVLPGRLELFSASEAEGGYLRLGYSDGLSVISVFVQPGTLDEEGLGGWRSERRGGHTIWVRDSVEQELIWASGGHVYTVFTDAPADMVDAAVAALPHDPEPGVWERLGRGAQAVFAWVNPFE
ncbi:sigma-E factor regulatory protein RseB domain-containing protein [Sinosporangium siamense]|uniref:MucB/RseB N-terminal domain-containing protein n=1 Tax=Sinosporangium siamense TaxID=1367973 RepID=A0A919RGS2_9ACTN|nr:sigma-E factor regulatory protein RseB domain-containing protein [Sinosporangium siamense]GII93087.1 hypothetical protein Ssi02_33180 [Sinosporangium siamense]